MTRRTTGFLTLFVLIILCIGFSYWAFKQADSNIKMCIRDRWEGLDRYLAWSEITDSPP